jgi:hypothetical protein
VENRPSAWIFDLALRFAAIVCLATLALGLFLGVDPITALMRSGVAFVVFLLLGWAVSALWDVAVPDEPVAGAEPNDSPDQPVVATQDEVPAGSQAG